MISKIINYYKQGDWFDRMTLIVAPVAWISCFTISYGCNIKTEKNAMMNTRPTFAKIFECPTTQVLCVLSNRPEHGKVAMNITLFGNDGLQTIPHAVFDGMSEATTYLDKFDYDKAEDLVDLYNNGPK